MQATGGMGEGIGEFEVDLHQHGSRGGTGGAQCVLATWAPFARHSLQACNITLAAGVHFSERSSSNRMQTETMDALITSSDRGH